MNLVHMTCDCDTRDSIRGQCWEILKKHRPEYKEVPYSDRLMLKKLAIFYIDNDKGNSKWI
jgi:hypothetical protein